MTNRIRVIITEAIIYLWGLYIIWISQNPDLLSPVLSYGIFITVGIGASVGYFYYGLKEVVDKQSGLMLDSSGHRQRVFNSEEREDT